MFVFDSCKCLWCFNLPEKFGSSSISFFCSVKNLFLSMQTNNFFRFNLILEEEFFFWCVRHSPEKLGKGVSFLFFSRCFFFLSTKWIFRRYFFLSAFFSCLHFFLSAFFFPLLFCTVLDETCRQCEFFLSVLQNSVFFKWKMILFFYLENSEIVFFVKPSVKEILWWCLFFLSLFQKWKMQFFFEFLRKKFIDYFV